jgi:hypothetical protein
MTDCLNSIE